MVPTAAACHFSNESVNLPLGAAELEEVEGRAGGGTASLLIVIGTGFSLGAGANEEP